MSIRKQHIVNNYSWLERCLFPSRRYTHIPSLYGKTILITGASHGIGQNVAITLAQKGCHFILVARTASALLETQQSIEERGGTADIYICDLRNVSEREDLITFLSHQTIHIFIHNAGHSIYRKISDSHNRYHDVDRLMQLHHHAPTHLILALLPQFISHQTHIFNVSALNVLLPVTAGWSAYQASKVAFDQWFQSTAVELRPRGLAFTTLYLPLVDTRMISPNVHYEQFPKMSVQHVSQIICHSIISRRRTFSPWWTPFVRWTALINRNIFEKIIIKTQKS